ncbi:hypothetical protein BGW38_001864 [Lunasporangiospora selenospora]|uniref:Uncharacterized protein n=1 Tax=Lunasporangiospora selenospora TaxID=979761 RepID=A0A9P6FSU9_9FUNG|nr:hypothetical protein BGW38_001864 [Lunasporangiospora selenospora]
MDLQDVLSKKIPSKASIHATAINTLDNCVIVNTAQRNCGFRRGCSDLSRGIPYIRDLITGTGQLSEHFRHHIRKYNSSLSFTSKGTKVDKELDTMRNGPFGSDLRDELLAGLYDSMVSGNDLLQAYRTVHEQEAGYEIADYKVVLKKRRQTDGRRQQQYDLPISTEVAVVMPNKEANAGRRDIVIEGKDMA